MAIATTMNHERIMAWNIFCITGTLWVESTYHQWILVNLYSLVLWVKIWLCYNGTAVYFCGNDIFWYKQPHYDSSSWTLGISLQPTHVASIQKAFRSRERDWKSVKKSPLTFCTYWFMTYSCTLFGKFCINPLMTNTEIQTFSSFQWQIPPGLLRFGHVNWIEPC